MTEVEDYISDVKDEVKYNDYDTERSEELEIKQESLAILASLGTTKEYLGVNMSLGDIKKLIRKRH